MFIYNQVIGSLGSNLDLQLASVVVVMVVVG